MKLPFQVLKQRQILFMPIKNIPFNFQKIDLCKNLPNHKFHFNKKKKSITYTIKKKRDYIIQINYLNNNKNYKVFIVNQKLPKDTPHLYKDKSLCLHFPLYKEWDSSYRYSETLIPWIEKWIINFEYWELFGKWVSNEITH